LNYTRAHLQVVCRSCDVVGLRRVRPHIVADPVGCQRAPLRS